MPTCTLCCFHEPIVIYFCTSRPKANWEGLQGGVWLAIEPIENKDLLFNLYSLRYMADFFLTDEKLMSWLRELMSWSINNVLKIIRVSVIQLHISYVLPNVAGRKD